MSWATPIALRLFERSVPSSDPDDLVRRGAQGDRAALIVVYRAHYTDVRNLAERLLGCTMTADDVVHEVFETLPRSLGRFRGDGTLRSYLLSITVRTAQRYLRAARRRRAAEARAAEAAGTHTNVTPLSSSPSERRELARLLAQALDALPTPQRVAFVLCEVEERSSQEAGAILEENPSTIRARVFQAKRRLRERLKELEAWADADVAGGLRR